MRCATPSTGTCTRHPEWTVSPREDVRAAEARRRIETTTIDRVDVDNGDSERVHQGHDLNDNRRPWFEGRNGRESKAAPFGYTLKVVGDAPVSLVTTCRAGDGRARTFDVLVDGTVIATETIPLGATELIDLEHAVPPALDARQVHGRGDISATRRRPDRSGVRDSDDTTTATP